MAYTLEGRSVGYDNIAAGSITGRENVVTGSSAPTMAAEDISVGNPGPEDAENIQAGVAAPDPEVP